MARRLLPLLPMLLVPAWACAPAAEPEPPALERVTSLARLAREGSELTARAPGFDVWVRDEGRAGVRSFSLEHDSRMVVFQHPPHRLRLGPIRAGRSCSLRFGFGLDTAEQPASGPVEFRVTLEDGELEERVFDETLDLRPGWRERDIALPPIASETFHLTLETKPAADSPGKAAPAGWSAPHVSCEEQRPAEADPKQPLIILISIDTLRPDHLGVYGYDRPTSPVLDAFAEQSLVFENAFATAPWTLPAHASMFTGLYPEEHGAGHANVDVPLAERFSTVAELLSGAGYRTLAFTAGALVTRARGLDQGFAEWTESFRPNLASVLPEVIDALGRARGEPTFLFLHTYDVHSPYGQAPGFKDLLETRTSALDMDRARFEERLRDRAAWAQLAAEPHNATLELGRFRDREELIAAYDSGIRFVDAHLGALFDYLRRAALFDQALIIVTSDHGESLLEQPFYIGHALYLYDTELRIPLIVRVPGGARRGRVDQLVNQVDLTSLILETAGVEPPEPLSGASPLARLDGRAPERRIVRGESSFTGARFARTLRWKLITPTIPETEPGMLVPYGFRDRFVGGEQIYDLTRDPGERENLAGQDAASPDALTELRELIEPLEPGGLSTPAVSGIADAEREQLRALGYVQ